jgi:hypothetical protein
MPLSWDAARTRMKELGISGFYLDTVPGGSCRFTCWMPDPAHQGSRRIESEAATEAEAVIQALARAAEIRLASR